MDSYFIAILVGLLTYFAMVIDAYINKMKIKDVHPKIPLFVTILIWTICEFFIKTPTKPIIPSTQVMQGGFYA